MEYKGIDVSYHNGTINWARVKEDGITFAIIRAGYGQNTMDKKFIENITGCIDNDIEVGIYWFLYCTNEAEAIANADKCHSVIQTYKGHIKRRVWCDFEYDTETKANAKGVYFNQQTRTACMVAFIERMKSYGYEVGNYINPDYLSKTNKLSYPMWLAKYSSSKGSYDPEIWQHSSKGSVAGISGAVDLDIGYFDNVVEEYTQIKFIEDVEKILGVTSTTMAFKMAPTISKNENKMHSLVTPLERYMKALGYYTGSIEADNGKTPIFGSGMEKAIKQYQFAVVKSSAKHQDGVLTKNGATWYKLLCG